MTTAESNTARQTVAEFREALTAAVDDARAAGIPWTEVVDGLDEERFRALRKRDEEKEAPQYEPGDPEETPTCTACQVDKENAPAAPAIHEEEEEL